MNENEMNFDIDVLRTFIDSVRHKSLAKAAELRGKSPSTVTLQIKRLEQQTGLQLFRRSGRGVLPTDHAQRLLRYAESIVFANDEAFQTINPVKAARVIRIAAPADLAETWLPPLLSAFLQDHPDLSVETQVMRNSEIIEKIDREEIDLAIHWLPSGGVGSTNPAATFPIEWMASRTFSTNQDTALPIVVLQSPCLFRDLGISELDKAHEPSRITMATTSVTGLWTAVAAGLGVTCRVPIGAPQNVQRYRDDRLPPLGTIDLALRTSKHAPSIATSLKESLSKALPTLIDKS